LEVARAAQHRQERDERARQTRQCHQYRHRPGRQLNRGPVDDRGVPADLERVLPDAQHGVAFGKSHHDLTGQRAQRRQNDVLGIHFKKVAERLPAFAASEAVGSQ